MSCMCRGSGRSVILFRLEFQQESVTKWPWSWFGMIRLIPSKTRGESCSLHQILAFRARFFVARSTARYLTRGLGDVCGIRVQDAFPWPTCSMHYQLVTAYRDFYSWVWYSLYDPHGPVHVWLGGILDCESTYTKISKLVGKDVAVKLTYLAFIHRKNLYRSGIFKCSSSVDVSEAPDEV